MENKMKNKKVVIGILVVALVVAGLVYTGCSEKKEEKEAVKTEQKKEDNKTSKKAKNEPVSEEKADNDKKIDEGKKDTVQAKTESKKESANPSASTKQAEPKQSKQTNSGSSSKQASKPTTQPAKPSTPTPSKPQPPAKKKVWVVDKPAWDEEVRQPVYVPTWWIKSPSGVITTYYNKSEWWSIIQSDETGDVVGSWGNGQDVPDPSGATKVVTVIHHAEEGHWEEQ